MLIVFDLDDTLYLERDYVRSGFRAVEDWCRGRYPVSDFSSKAWSLFKSGIRRDIFNRIMSEVGCNTPTIIDQMVEAYRSHQPEISLLPDARDFLEANRQRTLALITDGYASAQKKKIEALSLRPYFKDIIITDTWGREYWKPHPRAFLTVQGKRSPADCIYIADNPLKDLDAPSQLGWAPSVRIRRDGSQLAKEETPTNCREVRSLTELNNFFRPTTSPA